MCFRKIALYAAIALIAFAGGFYLAILLQGMIEIIAGVAITFAFLTWLGSGVDLLGLLREWYRQKTEEERIPILQFYGLFRNNEPAYFLRVQMTRGYGKAEKCEGFLFVEGTEINNLPTVWAHESARSYDIGGYMDLRLFRVEEEHYEAGTIGIEKSITFPLARLEKGFTEKRTLYNEVVSKKLTVKIYATIGKIPEPFSKRIEDIIKEAKQEPSLDRPVSSKYWVNNDN